jgi:hypothetical protein
MRLALPKGGDSLPKPCVGYVGDGDGLPSNTPGGFVL